MTDDTPYNGSTVLVKKIETLLGDKKLSTPAAMRLMLELKLDDIKQAHLQKEEIARIKQDLSYSWGIWASRHPKKATVLFLVIYSFSISDIRQPVMGWILSNVKVILSLL